MVIPELRQRLVIEIAIRQALSLSLSRILRTDDSKKLKALSLLQNERLLDEKGQLTNVVFQELSLKMYFKEMIEDWLQGKELKNLSDKRLGGIPKFDFIFWDFLIDHLHDENIPNMDSLIEFLKNNISQYKGFAACLFHRLLRATDRSKAIKMLNTIPILAKLPIFRDGARIQFPINVAIDELDKGLIELLLQHGVELHSPRAASVATQETTERPEVLRNVEYRGEDYYCLIPLRGAVASACRWNNGKQNKEFLSFLVDKGARPNDPVDVYHQFYPLLHIAVDNFDLSSVSFLLDYGMNPEVYDQYGKTALGRALDNFLLYSRETASLENHQIVPLAKEILLELVRKGAKQTSLLHQNALTRLVAEGHYDLAKFFRENGF